MHCMTFDIETVPDVASGRRLHGLDGLSDADVYKAMAFKQLQKTGSEFMPLHLQRVVAISALRTGDEFRVWSLGDAGDDEAALIRRFFDGLDRYVPDLVSWNGSGFDLPVLHYRALKHGISSSRYWDTGDDNREFRYNNYLSRFHWRDIVGIRRYCETDVVNTYLVFLHFEHMRGHLDQPMLTAEIDRVRQEIGRADEPHWREYLAAWDAVRSDG